MTKIKNMHLDEVKERIHDVREKLKEHEEHCLDPNYQFTDEERETRDSLIKESSDLLERHKTYSSIQELHEQFDAMGERHQPQAVRKRAPSVETTSTAPGFCFRDPTTGQEVRALSSREQLSPDEQGLNVGNVLYAMLTNRSEGLTDVEHRDMLGGSDTGGGYLLSPKLSATVVDLARASSVALRAGAQTIPMETSELALVRITGDPTAQWLPEMAAATPASAVLGRITLRAKTLRCHLPVSIELLDDATNAPPVLQGLLQRVLGAELDRTVLVGSGATEPLGIATSASTNALDFNGSVTNVNGWDKLSEGVEQVLVDNFNGEISDLSLVWHPSTARLFDVLQDSSNQPQQPTPWLSQVQKFTTTTMTAPSDANAIVGDFRQVLIGMRTSGVQIRILDGGNTVAGDSVVDSYARTIVAAMRVDVALLQPTWFSTITNIDA